MKSLFLMFASFIMIIGLPAAYDALDGGRTDLVTENFANVTGNTSGANVTLGQELSHDAVTEVEEVTSNNSLDSPSASTYNSASRVLYVSGIVDASTRTLSVDYRIASATNPSGLNNFFSFMYWAYIMTIIAFAGGAGYNFFQT